MSDNPIEIHFPLSDINILKLLKGTEFNQIQYINNDLKIQIKVYSTDRVKHISYDNWRKICAKCYNDPVLMDLIREIENE